MAITSILVTEREVCDKDTVNNIPAGVIRFNYYLVPINQAGGLYGRIFMLPF